MCEASSTQNFVRRYQQFFQWFGCNRKLFSRKVLTKTWYLWWTLRWEYPATSNDGACHSALVMNHSRYLKKCCSKVARHGWWKWKKIYVLYNVHALFHEESGPWGMCMITRDEHGFFLTTGNCDIPLLHYLATTEARVLPNGLCWQEKWDTTVLWFIQAVCRSSRWCKKGRNSIR